MAIVTGTDKIPHGASVSDYLPSKTSQGRTIEPPPDAANPPMQTLLATAESAAHRNEMARRKWQLLSLMSLMLIVPACVSAVWLYSEFVDVAAEQARLRIANRQATEAGAAARAEVSALAAQVSSLKNRNLQLEVENTTLKAQLDVLAAGANLSSLAAATGHSRSEAAQASPITQTRFDDNRLDAIRQGRYPADMTRAELVAALGEPDRILKSDKYEQLLYFDRSPGRFWFSNGPFLNASE